MTLLAATAAADITPLPGLVLQGHFSLNPSHSVLAPLEIRSLVLAHGEHKAAIITIDVIGICLDHTARIRREIHKRCGIDAHAVLVAASHTHCAPATIGVLGLTPDPDFIDRVCDAAVNATVEADACVEPVNVGLGASSAHFNINRRPLPGRTEMTANPGGIVDRRVRVLRLDRLGAGENPLATLFHYSCHPTSKAGSEGFICPDYPGLARARIEQRLGGHALFLPGCFGNVRPNTFDGNTFASASPEQLADFGDQLAQAVCFAAQNILPQPAATLHAATLDIDMPFGLTIAADALEAMAGDDSTDLTRQVTMPWARRVRKLVVENRLPGSERSQMQLLRVGPLLCIAIPGEPVQEIGHDIETQLTPVTDAHDVWPLGYCNDMLGYFCTDQHHEEGGYEPNAYIYFDRPAPFNDEQQTITRAAVEMSAPFCVVEGGRGSEQ